MCDFFTVLYRDTHYPLIQTKRETNTKLCFAFSPSGRSLILGLFHTIHQYIFQYFKPETLLKKEFTTGVWSMQEVLYPLLSCVSHLVLLMMLPNSKKKLFNALPQQASVNFGTYTTLSSSQVLCITSIDSDKIGRLEINELTISIKNCRLRELNEAIIN